MAEPLPWPIMATSVGAGDPASAQPSATTTPGATGDAPRVPPGMDPGVVTAVASGVRRVVAPNPGLMTGPGTNTYLVGEDPALVVDPGPDDDEHLAAVMAATGGQVAAVLVTHTHVDHSPLSRRLRELTGAPVLGFGAVPSHRAARLDSDDPHFSADRMLADGDHVDHAGFRLVAVHTPGHASNHLCWYHEGHRLLCSGDHIMGGSTVVIRPPDGDMAVYLASLEKVVHVDPPVRHIAPGHGRVLVEPDQVVADLVSHRLGRERRVVKALGALGAGTVDDLIPVAYADVSEQLRPVARFSLWAHLAKLAAEGRAIMEPLQGPVDPASLGLEVTWRAPE